MLGWIGEWKEEERVGLGENRFKCCSKIHNLAVVLEDTIHTCLFYALCLTNDNIALAWEAVAGHF